MPMEGFASSRASISFSWLPVASHLAMSSRVGAQAVMRSVRAMAWSDIIVFFMG